MEKQIGKVEDILYISCNKLSYQFIASTEATIAEHSLQYFELSYQEATTSCSSAKQKIQLGVILESTAMFTLKTYNRL